MFRILRTVGIPSEADPEHETKCATSEFEPKSHVPRISMQMRYHSSYHVI